MYNLLDFDGDALTVNSYTLESDTLFNTFTITKTSENGGGEIGKDGDEQGGVEFFAL